MPVTLFLHTVTVYTLSENAETAEITENITVVKGVLFDGTKAANVRTSGTDGADSVDLFIPFDAECVDGVTKARKVYAGPKEYSAAQDKSTLWTMDPGRTFFVKGEVVKPGLSFQEINRKFDHVHLITKVDVKDFGGLPHFQVGGQ